MRSRRAVAVTALFLVSLAGCLSFRDREEPPPPVSLTGARVQASTVAPSLPILVLRTARDEMILLETDRSNIAMVTAVAELDARTLDRARAAMLEGLARDVEAGAMDASRDAMLVEQMSWAAGEAAPRLARALDELSLLLTPTQRRTLVARVRGRIPTWSLGWADEGEHAWLEAWVDGRLGKLSDFTADLERTSRRWAEKCVAHVREELPRLDAEQRRALAAAVRTAIED